MENRILSSRFPTMYSSADCLPPWVELPREITASILRKLGPVEMLTVALKVCTAWRSVCTDKSMWRSIELGRDYYRADYLDDLDKLCRRAVDLSQGELVDIMVFYFCDDELLVYISERCPQLKRLLLQQCDIFDEAWHESLRNLPLLEEVHLEHTPVGPTVIEAIGTSCPLLRSFKLNQSWYEGFHGPNLDREAHQIAQKMPQLRHLEVMGNQMSNKGLQAILDGCPHLETLDLRECFNINFNGSLAKLCCRRIRDLRRPLDEIVGGEEDNEDYMDLTFEYGGGLEFSEGGSSS